MWLRAFAVLFELRARVIANFNSRTLDTIKSITESHHSPQHKNLSRKSKQYLRNQNRQSKNSKNQATSSSPAERPNHQQSKRGPHINTDGLSDEDDHENLNQRSNRGRQLPATTQNNQGSSRFYKADTRGRKQKDS